MDKVDSATLLNFLSGLSPDTHGRYLREMWEWDYERLESVHNYIQWMFPNPVPSQFQPDTPLLTQEAIDLIKADEEIQANMKHSLLIMLRFYGFDLEQNAQGVIFIRRGRRWDTDSLRWVTENNHNYLRLTRILTCLMLVGMEDYAIALYDALEHVYADNSALVGAKTLKFWQAAVDT